MDPEDQNNESGGKHIRDTINSKKVRVTDTEIPNVGISSQIIDYYNRFGHNRDLEKYLALTCSPMRLNADSNSFISGYVGSTKFSQATAPERMEVCRLAVNCSLDDSCSSVKETSYALDDILESKEDSVEVDDGKNAQVVQVDSDVYKNPPSDTDSPRKSAEQNLDTSLNKPVSPSSSITSRRLEWDSLADIGYSDNGGKTLSTLERMALHQQYANSGELDKAEDKMMGLPTAQSTPINLLLPLTSVHGKSKTSNKNDIRLKKNMKKSVKINQPVVKETIEEHFIGDHIPGTINVNLTKNVSVNFRKMNKDDNVIKEDNKVNTFKLKNISTNTSVLTNSDKEIQTTMSRENTNSVQNFITSNGNQIDILSEKPADIKYIPIMLKLGKKTQNISVVTRHLKRKKFKQKYKKVIKSQTCKSDESKIIYDKIELKNEPSSSQLIRNGENELSEAESFEYLPGHMYQCKDISSKESPEKPTVSTSRTTSLESSVGVTSSSQGTDQQDSERSFSKDLRASIALLNKLVEERHKDASLKRRLIKSVIKKLLKTKYRDDASTPEEHTSPNLADESEQKNTASNDKNKGTSTSARDTSEETELLQSKKSNSKKSILRKRHVDLKSNASPAHSAPDLAMRKNLYNTKEVACSSLSLELEKLLLQSTYRSNASSKSSLESKKHSDSIHTSSDDKKSPEWLKSVTISEKLYEKKAKEKHFKQQTDSFSKSTQSAFVIGNDKCCWVPYDTVLYENIKSEDANVAKNLVKELSRLPKEIGSGDSRLDSIKSPVGIGNAPRRMHTVFTLAGLNYHNQKTEIPSSSGYKKGRETVSADSELSATNRQKTNKEESREPGGSLRKKNNIHYCCCPNDGTSNILEHSQLPKNITTCDCCNLGKCVLERQKPGEFKCGEILTNPRRPLHICDAEGKIIANFNNDFIIYKRVTEPPINDGSNRMKSDVIRRQMFDRQVSLNEVNNKNERSEPISESGSLESEKASFNYANQVSGVYNMKSQNRLEDKSLAPEWDSDRIHKEKVTPKTRKSDSDSLTTRMESQKKDTLAVNNINLPSSKKSTCDRSLKRDDRNKKRNDNRGDNCQDENNDDRNVKRNDRRADGYHNVKDRNVKKKNIRGDDSHDDNNDDINARRNYGRGDDSHNDKNNDTNYREGDNSYDENNHDRNVKINYRRGDDSHDDNIDDRKENLFHRRADDSHDEKKYDLNVESNDTDTRNANYTRIGNNICDQYVMDTKEIQTRLSINTKALKPTLQDINIDDHEPPCQCTGTTCCGAIVVSAQKHKKEKKSHENEILENRTSQSSGDSEDKIVPELKKMPVMMKAQDKKLYESKASTQNTDKYDEVISNYTNGLRDKDKSPPREIKEKESEKNISNRNNFFKYDENSYRTKSSVKKSDIGSPRTEMLRSRNEIIADVHTMRNHLHKMAEHKCHYTRHKNVCERLVPETVAREHNTQPHHRQKTDCGENTRSISKSDKSVSTKSDKSSRSIYSPVRSDRRREQDRLIENRNKYIERNPIECERNYIHSERNSKYNDNKSITRAEHDVKKHNQEEKFIEPRIKSRNSERENHSASRRTSGFKSGIEYSLSSTSSMTIDSRSVRRPDLSDCNSNEIYRKIDKKKYIIPKSPKKFDKTTYTTKSDYTTTTQNVGTQSVDVDSNHREKLAINHSQNRPDVSKESKNIGTTEHYINSAKSERTTVKSQHDGDNQALSASSSLSYTDSLKNLIEMFKENEKKLEGGRSNKITPRDKQNDILRQLKFLLSATTVNVETDSKKDHLRNSKPVNLNSHNIDTQTTGKIKPQNAANDYRMYETGRSRMYQVHQAAVGKDSTETTSEQAESPMTSHAQKLFHKFKKAYDKLYSQHSHCCQECCKFMQQMHNKGDSCKVDLRSEHRSNACGKCGTRYSKFYHDTDSSTPVCCSHKCLNRRPFRRTDNKPKVIKRSLAYNLILEPSSHSIDENVSSKKKPPLKDVFMKIPKSNFVNYNQTSEKETRRCHSNENFQANEDHIFPGNVYSYPTSSRDGFVRNERRSSAPDSSPSEPVYNTMSLQEYLHKNRPDFVANADKRHDEMRALQGLRLRHDAAKRVLVSLGAAAQGDAQKLSLTDVREVARDAGVAMPHNFADLEKPIKEKEMKRHSQKIFKQLPEQLQKKEKRKKEMVKQTNRLMASLYRKSLQKKALRGTVTMSHYTSIISL